MASFFHANEIAEAAVEIERKGQAFYLRVAARAKEEKTRALFDHLAKEEAKHEVIFANLKERLGEVELPAWSTEEEYMTYVDSLIASHTLFNEEFVDKFVEASDDETAAIHMAMSFEKDTLLFFMEMKELVPATEKDAVQSCIEEERLHLRQLRAMLAK